MAAPKKAKGLGKGLDALFGDVEVTPVKSADKKESSKPAKAEQRPDRAKAGSAKALQGRRVSVPNGTLQALWER